MKFQGKSDLFTSANLLGCRVGKAAGGEHHDKAFIFELCDDACTSMEVEIAWTDAEAERRDIDAIALLAHGESQCAAFIGALKTAWEMIRTPQEVCFTNAEYNPKAIAAYGSTNCPQGGDGGHGGFTTFELTSYNRGGLLVSIDNGKWACAKKVTVSLYGDCENETVKGCLQLAIETLCDLSPTLPLVRADCDVSEQPLDTEWEMQDPEFLRQLRMLWDKQTETQVIYPFNATINKRRMATFWALPADFEPFFGTEVALKSTGITLCYGRPMNVRVAAEVFNELKSYAQFVCTYYKPPQSGTYYWLTRRPA